MAVVPSAPTEDLTIGHDSTSLHICKDRWRLVVWISTYGWHVVSGHDPVQVYLPIT